MIRLTRRTMLASLSALVAIPARSDAAWPNRPISLVHGFMLSASQPTPFPGSLRKGWPNVSVSKSWSTRDQAHRERPRHGRPLVLCLTATRSSPFPAGMRQPKRCSESYPIKLSMTFP